MKKLPVIFFLISVLLTGCSSSDQSSSNQNAWINSPYSGLDESSQLAAVGSGATFEKAKEKSLKELGNYFQVKINSRVKITSSYSENNKSSDGWADKFDEQIFTSSNTKLSYVNYDISEKVGDVFYVRAVLDKVAFGMDLSSQYNDEFEVLSAKYEESKKNTLQMLKFTQIWKKESEKLKRISQYLTVLNMSTGNSELVEIEKSLVEFKKNTAIVVQSTIKNETENKNSETEKLLKSALDDEFRKMNSGFNFGIEKDNQLYILCTINIESQSQTGKDLFSYCSYSYMILDKDKEVLEQSAGNAKGAGNTITESYRQVGVKIARQISDGFAM